MNSIQKRMKTKNKFIYNDLEFRSKHTVTSLATLEQSMDKTFRSKEYFDGNLMHFQSKIHETLQ